jgi:hypothetical protein
MQWDHPLDFIPPLEGRHALGPSLAEACMEELEQDRILSEDHPSGLYAATALFF